MKDKKIIYPMAIERDVYEEIKTYADKEDLSAAQVIRRALRREVKVIQAEGKSEAVRR